MYRKIIILAVIFFTAISLEAQNLWQATNVPNNILGEQKITPSQFSSFQLNQNLFNQTQAKVKNGYSNDAIIISLPNPNGGLDLYTIFEEKILHPNLEKKYEIIKTYTAINLLQKNIIAKLDYTEFGFHAMVNNGNETYFIEPFTNINSGYYMCFYKKNITKNLNHKMQCLVDAETEIIEGGIDLSQDLPPLTGVVNKVNGTMRKNYDLALACTGEYAIAVGGANPTIASVLSAMVTSVNRVSGVYELEYAVHLNLIANNDTLIYLDGTTDPYTNNSGSTMLGENATTINTIIGSANYDIGHVFSTGGGGIASLGSVCGTNKANGVTGLSNPVGDGFDIDYVAHEMGHQFGGSHTFDAQTGSCSGNRSSQSAYEVGSGTTIQAYAGICGINDVQPHSDAYFSIRSLNQMGTFITTGGGRLCPDSVAYGNTPPSFTPIADTFYIPYLSYFELTAPQVTDAENDLVTYCWEQYNRSNTGITWDAPTTTNPIYRTFIPSPSSTRIFPVIDSCINNVYKYKGERSPDTARTMRFKLAVRDVHNGFGCFNYSEDSIVVHVVQGTELFRVTSQNTAGLILNGGFGYPVNWVVAGTDTGNIAAQRVDIFLSTDGGYTYPITLASNVANNGLSNITLPNIDANVARIKVKGAGNIFFDLNDTPFAIKKTEFPTLISNSNINDVKVYPNPANNILNISNVTKPTNMQLLNSMGQIVYKNTIQKDAEINIAHLADGLYILQLRSNNAMQNISILKK